MRSVEEIFSDINARMIKGLMFHSQMADYYRFLNLEKYSNCHEKHYNKESENWRKLSKYYINHFNKLIMEKEIDNPNEIPNNWYNAAKQDVDTSTIRNSVEKGLKDWLNWETETKQMYEEAFSELLSLNQGAVAMRIKKYLVDVDNELAEVMKYYLNKKATDFNITHIIEEQ